VGATDQALGVHNRPPLGTGGEAKDGGARLQQFAGCRSSFHVLATGPATDFKVRCYAEGLSGAGLRIEFDASPALYEPAGLAGQEQAVLGVLHDPVRDPERRLPR